MNYLTFNRIGWVAGRPVHAAVLGSWSGPFLQEIPLHLELADLLVQASHQGVVVLVLLLLALIGPVALVEDGGRAIDQGFLPSLNLAGMDLVPRRQLVTASRATLALNAGLCFLRPLDISHSSLAATAALSLGAGLSLSYLSSSLGPPQTSARATSALCLCSVGVSPDREEPYQISWQKLWCRSKQVVVAELCHARSRLVAAAYHNNQQESLIPAC